MQAFLPSTSITFVSKASVESGTVASYNLNKRIEVVKDCRKIGKKDMKYNDVMPKMKVDPETYVCLTVTAPTRLRPQDFGSDGKAGGSSRRAGVQGRASYDPAVGADILHVLRATDFSKSDAIMAL